MTQSTQTQPEWLVWVQPAVLVALLVAVVGGTWHLSAQGARLETKVEQNAAAIVQSREAHAVAIAQSREAHAAAIAQSREVHAAAIAQSREAHAAAFAELRDAIRDNAAAIRSNGVAINANAVAIGKLTGQYEEHQRHHERLVARQIEQNP